MNDRGPVKLDETSSRLAENVMHFAQFLRRAGLPIGTAQVLDAVQAMLTVGVTRRDEVYAALHATFVSRREHDELFALGFDTFWRDPFGATEAMSLLLPPSRMDQASQRKKGLPQRIKDAWRGPGPRSLPRHRPNAPAPPPEIEVDFRRTSSDEERLRGKDFEQMTAAEEAAVRKQLIGMRFPWRDLPTRRTKRALRGHRVDLRGTLHASRRSFGEPLGLRFLVRRTRPPPLVVLCDISGSMERYSRMVLHFLHALTNDRDRVEVFVFGTRLTHVTRALRHRDVDRAFEEVATAVQDWSGGTRLGQCLQAFHQDWSRRVLGQGAVLLLITDGLARDDVSLVAEAAQRIHLASRKVIWLNPLLRFDDFEPTAEGVAALLPHVDEHRPVHNLQSLASLAEALAR
ncbi:MAG: VWA domain-containing protein [Myxococcales bacterium]|nr:VWA domain-containing protein [Myxococcales bacterium]